MGPDWQVTPLGCSGPISGSTLDAGCWTLDGFTAPGVGKCSCAFLGPFSMLAAAAGDVVRANFNLLGRRGRWLLGCLRSFPPVFGSQIQDVKGTSFLCFAQRAMHFRFAIHPIL